MAYVHIVISDTGWILERLAKEISSRLDYVSYSLSPDTGADIQYYLTYSARKGRVSPIEIAFFSHLEKDSRSAELFFDIAGEVEHCVCMAPMYQQILRDHGVTQVTTISPGVDFSEMQPKIKIGVVGRTYHTGRKGEALVQAVLDEPGIDWHFTGEGWPGPARQVPQGEMGAFYNEMDYILVPALYEGGPMSVIEALACGTPVIAPEVGFVPELPHISYQVGDGNDLRRVLREIVAKRFALRDTVLDRKWENWARGHDDLFRSLLEVKGLAPSPFAEAEAHDLGAVALVLHGSEANALGGPSVRVPQTAHHLRALGCKAQAGFHPLPYERAAALVHGFNVWPPASGVAMVRDVKTLGTPLVLSPICLDLSEMTFWQSQIPTFFASVASPDQVDSGLIELHRAYVRDSAAGRLPRQSFPGHHESVREMISSADHVILLAEHERATLAAIGAHPRVATVVRNAVDHERFAAADPELFGNNYGVKDYILCVARIEPRKNQLLLLHALRDLDLPIVLVGHVGDAAYRDLLTPYTGPNVHFIGRLAPDGPLLPSALAGARVVVLPSWCEGAPLVALEAAACGTRLVLSNRSSEREYFGDLASYCDPGDPASIRTAVLEAHGAPANAARSEALKALVRERHSWVGHARETLAVYRRTLADFTPAPGLLTDKTEVAIGTILFDVTTSCYNGKAFSGIPRFELSLAQALARRDDLNVRFIAWHDATKQFVGVSADALNPRDIALAHDTAGWRPLLLDDLVPGARLVTGGSAWMQNQDYTSGLIAFSHASNAALTVAIHDIIPCLRSFWFDAGYSEIFKRNLSLLLRAARHVLAGSQCTRADIETYAFENGIALPPLGLLRYGDASFAPQSGNSEAGIDAHVSDRLSGCRFILSVGAIHERKNHRLLYNLWVKLYERLGPECPHLVLVGGVAWNGANLARAFREDARIASLVHILDDVEDAQLEWLYSRALFTVYPSLYEGWGLPVAESLSRGKICLASKVASIQEIAPNVTDLIDPDDFSGWMARVSMYVTSAPARAFREAEIRAGYRARTWDDAVGHMLGELVAVRPSTDSCCLYPIGSRLDFSVKNPAIALSKRSGWYESEALGSFASANLAQFGLRIARPLRGDGVLGLVLHAPDLPFSGDVCLDQRLVGRFTLDTTDARLVTFVLPAALLAGKTTFEISLRSAMLVEMETVFDETVNRRRVGIGLAELFLSASEDFNLADFRFAPSLAETLISVGERYELMQEELPYRWFGSPMRFNPCWGWYSTIGNPVISAFLPSAAAEDLDLEISYRAVATDDCPFHALVIGRDGSLLGRLAATDTSLQTARIRIGRNLLAAEAPLRLEIAVERPKSPEQLGLGTFPEAVGIGLVAIGFVRAGASFDPPSVLRPAIAFGQAVAFGLERAGIPGAHYLDPVCWHRTEPDGVWSFGRGGRLTLPLAKLPVAGLSFELQLTTLRPQPTLPHRLSFRFADGPTLSCERPPEATSVEICLPVGDLALDPAHPVLVVTIESAYELTPYGAFGAPDERLLGVFLQAVTIREWVPPPIVGGTA